MKLTNQDYYRAFLIWWTRHFSQKEYDQVLEHFNHPDVTSSGRLTGWLRAARESLLISSDVAANRMRISRSGYLKLEKSEQEGKISLETLARAAEALDCELIYAIRPKKRMRFSQMIWQKLLREAEMHSWVRRSSAQVKGEALAKIASELFEDPEFRKRQGWKRR